jgi:hypothetical protein
MNESDLKQVDEQPRRIRDSLKPIAVVSIVASPEISRVPTGHLGRDHAHIKKARQSFKNVDVARKPWMPTP